MSTVIFLYIAIRAPDPVQSVGVQDGIDATLFQAGKGNGVASFKPGTGLMLALLALGLSHFTRDQGMVLGIWQVEGSHKLVNK